MNNLIANFDQVLNFATQYGMPVAKKRGIIREYIQSKFIAQLYALKGSEQLSFVGGTSLRLLRNLPRFSEDLDFDLLGLSDTQVVELIDEVVKSFARENIPIEIVKNDREGKTYVNLKFPSLLLDLKISSDPKEKLMIKLDYARVWKGQTPQTVLFSRYGFIEQVVTNSLDQLLVQKLTAYVQRRETQPRDIYDVVWLYAQGARIDWDFARANGQSDLVKLAQMKVSGEGVTAAMKRKLEPFLFEEGEVEKMNLFEMVLKDLLINR